MELNSLFVTSEAIEEEKGRLLVWAKSFIRESVSWMAVR